ncbi:homeobox protein PKNOX [Acrasis kona]|uniref:Homeobox protein PKNOX n=1 Tax=Acrasis kona TaxID=1008807 RepID=A0AAW2YQW7_9EUKA
MTLPNKIGYDVHAIAESKKHLAAEQQKALLQQQYHQQYGGNIPPTMPPHEQDGTSSKTAKKRSRTFEKESQKASKAIKDEITDMDERFEQLVASTRARIKKTRITKAGEEPTTTTQFQQSMEDDEQSKRRRVVTDDYDILDADQLINKITHFSQLFLHSNEKEKNRLLNYVEDNREMISSLLVKSQDQDSPVDYESLMKWVIQNPLHRILYSAVSKMIPRRSFQPEEKQRPVTLIEMNHDDILVVFLGKEGCTQDKEEVAQFLERFDGLQNSYKQELEIIHSSRDQWTSRFEQVLNEHSNARFVGHDERQRVIYATTNKFEQLIHALQDKYLTQIFNLQESVLLRSKKRGNLPKHATNVLKTWLFSNFLHPYPSEQQKVELSSQTQLTITQINNWFINARVRTWRPMLESMLDEKNKSGGSNQASNVVMHANQQQQQQQMIQNRSRAQPSTSGNAFSTLSSFVGNGPPDHLSSPGGNRYNTRRVSNNNMKEDLSNVSGQFPHMWHDSSNPELQPQPQQQHHHHMLSDPHSYNQQGPPTHDERYGQYQE